MASPGPVGGIGRLQNEADVRRFVENLLPPNLPVLIRQLQARPAARVRHSANQTIADTTITTLAFDTEDFDPHDMHDPAANTRLTAPASGLYAIGARVAWAFHAAGRRTVFLNLNGSTTIADNACAPVPDAGIPTRHQVTDIYRLSEGDYIEAAVRQTSGGNLAVNSTSPADPAFWMHYLGPG